MKRFSLWSVLVLFVLVFVVGCGGKSTTLEGKVVDGQGKPLAKVTVAAKMSQPIKGYEQFETTTGADGSFKFGKLFPTSEYQLILFSEHGTEEKRIKTDSGLEGQTKKLPMLTIRFIVSKEGVVLDTLKNLMWAAKDNCSNINWANAKSYCENYRSGGYLDWRMPTSDELVELKASGGKINNICPGAWTSETRGSEAAIFIFHRGELFWDSQSRADIYGALPVRSGK